jgi:hypothetical protein
MTDQPQQHEAPQLDREILIAGASSQPLDDHDPAALIGEFQRSTPPPVEVVSAPVVALMTEPPSSPSSPSKLEPVPAPVVTRSSAPASPPPPGKGIPGHPKHGPPPQVATASGGRVVARSSSSSSTPPNPAAPVLVRAVSASTKAPAPAGLNLVPPPGNRFLVQNEKGHVRIRGLPIGRLSATEARALAAWLVYVADKVATPADQEFSDLYSSLLLVEGATAET